MTELFTPHPGSRLDGVSQANAHAYPDVSEFAAEVQGDKFTVATRNQIADTATYRTVTLNAANPYLLVSPQDPTRYRATFIPNSAGCLYLCESKELAMAVVNGNTSAGALITANTVVQNQWETWVALAGTSSGLLPVPQKPLNAQGSVTSPTAGQQIANLLSLNTSTYYQLQWSVSVSGTLAAADANNMQISIGGPGLGMGNSLLQAGYPAVAGSYPQPTIIVATAIVNTTSIPLTAANAPTTGAIYGGQLVATPYYGTVTNSSATLTVITERYADASPNS